MTFIKSTALLAVAIALTACASGPKGSQGAGGFQIDVASQSERILADARKKRNDEGCAKAIPSYRVVASFGKGHDTAQYELGACLMEIAANPVEGALLREEGAFWLRRAAYAGNARAQLTLASSLSGADGHSVAGLAPDLVEGYGWSLIYSDNAAHKLYGLPELHPVAADHFRTQMTPDMINDAEAFAARYRQVEMDVFTPPVFESPARRGGQFGPGARERRRR